MFLAARRLSPAEQMSRIRSISATSWVSAQASSSSDRASIAFHFLRASLSLARTTSGKYPSSFAFYIPKSAARSVGTWNLKSQDASIRHIGPMAEDFRKAFGVGDFEGRITSSDADGVALGAIQGLHQLLEEKDAEMAMESCHNEWRKDAGMRKCSEAFTMEEGGKCAGMNADTCQEHENNCKHRPLALMVVDQPSSTAAVSVLEFPDDV